MPRSPAFIPPISAHRGHAIVFYAFDLLHLNGGDLTSVPLQERRKRLPDVVKGSGLLLKALIEMRRTDPAGREFGPERYVFGNEVGERVKSVREVAQPLHNDMESAPANVPDADTAGNEKPLVN